MPRTKKEIDKELMYKKIMPSAARPVDRSEDEDEEPGPRTAQRSTTVQGDRFAGKQLDKLAANVRKRAAELENDEETPEPLTPRGKKRRAAPALEEPEADDDDTDDEDEPELPRRTAGSDAHSERFAGKQLDKLAASVHKRAVELENDEAELLPPAMREYAPESAVEPDAPRAKRTSKGKRGAPKPRTAENEYEPTLDDESEADPFDLQPAYGSTESASSWPARAPERGESETPFPFAQVSGDEANFDSEQITGESTELNAPPPMSLEPPAPALVNIMEKLVADHLDSAIAKFRCCRCDKCRKNIVAIALNKLQPRYVVIDTLESPLIADRKTVTEVMSALVQAVLAVKAHPRH